MAAKPKVKKRIIQSIKIDLIQADMRLRQVDPDHVAGIADSMAINGLQNPIEVVADSDTLFRLVSGAHRLAAAKLNEWQEIDAVVVSGTDDELLLREIDENLLRRELSPLDRCVFIARRKEIYERLNPDMRQGLAGANARWHATAKFAFASETAEKLGISERYIRLADFRFKNITPEVRERIALTWIAAKGTELDALTRADNADQQMQAVEMVLSGEEEAPKSIAAALKILRGVREEINDNADIAGFLKFQKAWEKNQFSAKEKGLILNYLQEKGLVKNLRKPSETEEAA